MKEELRHCQFCGDILPPWRLFDCDGKNQHGRGNCELSKGSGGYHYHPEMSWTATQFWEEREKKDENQIH